MESENVQPSERPRPGRVGRRAWLRAAAALGGLGAVGALEFWKLAGGLDHRQLRPSAPGRFTEALASVTADDDALLHVGHSTHLLSLGGVRVLTDPWFHDPAHGGMTHADGPACAPDALTDLDLIAITHEHPDHADPIALDRMDKRALVLVPTQELRARVAGLGYRRVEVLQPWQTIEARGLTVTATPAIHDVVEIGYVIERAQQRVYFAGDTALHPHMEAIAERMAPTAAILPVDGTVLTGDGRWVMNPTEAAQAARMLGVKTVVPSHAGAAFTGFVLGLWARTIPEADLALQRVLEGDASGPRCVAPRVGERIDLASG